MEIGSTLMEDSDVFSLVDNSTKCMKDTTRAVFMCQKLEQPLILEIKFCTNTNQNNQHI